MTEANKKLIDIIQNYEDYFDKPVLRNFDKRVQVWHHDGSYFDIKHATWREDEINNKVIYVVGSEHNGVFIFYKEDLDRFEVTKRIV